MARYCFLLQVRPELLPEYKARHADVWPDMRAALSDTGWRNYSLFVRDDGLLVGYVESDDLDAAQRAMAATDVNRRWQAEMARFFVGLDGRPPDEGLLLLEEIFHLGPVDEPPLVASGGQVREMPAANSAEGGGRSSAMDDDNDEEDRVPDRRAEHGARLQAPEGVTQ